MAALIEGHGVAEEIDESEGLLDVPEDEADSFTKKYLSATRVARSS